MLISRTIGKVIVAATLIAVAFVVTAYLRAGRNQGVGPRICYAGQIQVESVEQGREVVVGFSMHNLGDSALSIYDIVTGCGCAKPEIESEGLVRSVRELEIPPNSACKLRLRWTARGVAGAPQHTELRFRTNDPGVAEGAIQFVMAQLLGGIQTQPVELPPLEPVVGRALTRVISVVNRSTQPYVVTNAELTGLPGRARLIPVREGVTADEAVGTFIGAVEFTLNGDSAGAFAGHLRIAVEGGTTKSVLLPIIGTFVNRVTLSPPNVTLPRRSSSGNTYQANVLCRDMTGEPIEVSSEEDNGPIRVQTLPVQVATAIRLVRVEWRDRMARAGERNVPLHIRRLKSGETENVFLRVAFRPTAGD